MKIAIYSRKSKITERGESMKNQIEMCKNYAQVNFTINENDITVYEDEGYSGGTSDRPKYKKLMNDIAKKHFNVLICYRLDRISRNVLDFSNVLEQLGKTGTSFVSVTEHFDTTTPMGRAMVNIAAVFAQLERETTAERIKDNLRRLARTGRYIGSTPPFGFKSERVEYYDEHGNKKKLHKLAPVSEDLAFIKLVFEKYLELESLAKVETWLMQNGHRNRNGNFTGTSELKRLLNNPVYVCADEAVYDYYIKTGADVVNGRDEFSGKCGMLMYNKRDRSGAGLEPEKWVVVLANHEGIIDSSKWLKAQYILEKNKIKAPRAGTSRNTLLTSKIKCGGCGGTMVIIYGANRSNYYYKCGNKIKSRNAVCTIKNINGQVADKIIFEYIKSLPVNPDKIKAAFDKEKKAIAAIDLSAAENSFIKTIKIKEKEMGNLTKQLRKNESSAAAKYIIADMEVLDAELSKLKNELNLIMGKKEKAEQYKAGNELLINTIEEKRRFIDKIIEHIVWDGCGFAIFFR